MKYFLLFTLLVFAQIVLAQKTIVGIVKDSHSEEPILFASIYFSKSGRGIISDSIGKFYLSFSNPINDTLNVSSIGYQTKQYPLTNISKDTFVFEIYLDRAKSKEEVVVKTKFNRGLMLWKKIVKHKADNDRFKFKNFSYNIYNKLELDIVNLNKEKLKEIKFLKPFSFILNNVDTTSEIKPFLPIFLTETYSKFYLQNNPRKTKEIITASRTSGIENESATKMLGGMYQNTNLYNNFIPVFNTDFVSPFSDNGDSYYKYKVVDTQYINNIRCFKLTFLPKRQGDNTFVGDCWISDSSFAVVNASLTLSKDANINYVEKLTMFQEFKLQPNNNWMLTKEKFIANIAPVGKNKLTITGRKTTNYTNIEIENEATEKELTKNKTKEDIIVAENAMQKTELFWQQQRPELLSKNENSIYKLMDTLQSMPLFTKYRHTINFLTTGTKFIGNWEIGPWYNWISGNSVEGTRLRFDIGSNRGFHKKLYLHGYAAYGFKDKVWKGKAEAFWLFKKDPRMWAYLGAQKDYDNGQVYYDEVSQDNIFSLAIRKPNVPTKFLFVNEKRAEFFAELSKGFSLQLGAIQKRFEPVKNLPFREDYPTSNGLESLNNFETFVKVRYAYLERFIEGNFYRTSLGSPRPIVEAKWSKGFRNVFGSAYNYNKVSLSVSDYIKIPPFGTVYYNVFAGKVFGTLPFTLLELHPGNEIFYYNKYAFNMMNRFEYISDQYAGLNVEHNIGNGLFKYIPITRKLKIRQFWNSKVLLGKLNDANTALNIKATNAFKRLNDNAYVELGTGVDNILKVFRVDCIWRVTQRDQTTSTFQRFAVFGSFRLAF